MNLHRRPIHRRWWSIGLFALALATAALALTPRVFGRGLVGTYYGGSRWAGSPWLVAFDRPGEGDWLEPLGDRFHRRPFSATWEGYLYVPRTGTYVFSLTSDDGSWLTIDGRSIVANPGEHVALEQRATIVLPAGAHQIRIRYFQERLGAVLLVRWAFEDQRLEPLTGQSLYPSRLAYFFNTRLPLGTLVPLLWTLGLIGGMATWLSRGLRAHLAGHADEVLINRSLLALLGGTAVVSLVGLGWGLPVGWEHDELRPIEVVAALERAFIGGWYDHYPPLYFYLLGVLSLPFKITGLFGVTDLWSPSAVLVQFALYRVMSVLLGLVTVYLTYRCGTFVFHSRLAGLWSGFFLAVAPNFVFHSKLAKPEVPYLACFAISLYFYLRAVREPRRSSYVLFASTAALTVCVKDQAYGFYVLPVVHLVALRWVRIEGPMGKRLRALVLDPLLLGALGAALVTFTLAQNVLLNPTGFLEHVRLITGGGSAPFRMYERTAAGYRSLLMDALAQLPWNLGWPAALSALVGLSWLARTDRAAAVALVLPVLSYVVFFIAIVMFHYDRFYLGVVLACAILAGGAMRALLASPNLLKVAVAAGVAGYTLLRGASVDLMMLRDSRHAAEAWMAEHAPAQALVGFVGPRAYLPRPGLAHVEDVEPSWDAVDALEPEFLVINGEYARRPPPPDTRGPWFYETLLNGTHTGYRLEARFKSKPGAALLAYEAPFRNSVEDAMTNLDKINPEILVFRRVETLPTDAADRLDR